MSVGVAVAFVIIGALRFGTDSLHEVNPDYWQSLVGTPLRYLVRAPSDGTLAGDLNAQFFKVLSIPTLLCMVWLSRRFGSGSLVQKATEFRDPIVRSVWIGSCLFGFTMIELEKQFHLFGMSTVLLPGERSWLNHLTHLVSAVFAWFLTGALRFEPLRQGEIDLDRELDKLAPLVLLPVVGAVAGCCADFEYQKNFELDTNADLNAVVGLTDGAMIATADGELIRASTDSTRLRQEAVEFSVDVPLNALAARDDRIWAVGDEGMFIQKIGDGDWEIVDLGTDARLLDVALAWDSQDWLIVVGDGVVRAQWLPTGVWYTPPEPDGGWGELRAVFDGAAIWAVGKGGVVWSCGDPSGFWAADDVGLGDVDLNAGGQREMDTLTWIVGDDGSLAYHNGSYWTPVDTGVREDLVDFASGLALARDGRLFTVYERGLDRVDKAAGLNRGLFSDGEDVILVGEEGRGRAYRRAECYGW